MIAICICNHGWICEEHRNRPWPHGKCPGPGPTLYHGPNGIVVTAVPEDADLILAIGCRDEDVQIAPPAAPAIEVDIST